MLTRRSFLLGATSLAVIAQPFPLRAMGADTQLGGDAATAPSPVPGNYPYDKPVPTMRSTIITPLPTRVVAGYWTYWGAPIRLTEIPPQYNTVFLFHATPVGDAPGTTGAVYWNMPGDERGAAATFTADLAEFRRTRTAILTIGGARANVDISTRERAQVLLDSIKRIYGDLGGFDGVDWNNYEGDQQPDTEQMIWVSQELKAAYGPNFAITSPPAPWRPVDLEHCRAMIDAGVMDMVSPQYYDGPGISEESYILESVDEWVTRMGDAGRVGIGFGLADDVSYSSSESIQRVWTAAVARHPGLRGVFNWSVPTDEGMGWPFATEVSPVVTAGVVLPPSSPVMVPPIVPIPLGLGTPAPDAPGTHLPGDAELPHPAIEEQTPPPTRT